MLRTFKVLKYRENLNCDTWLTNVVNFLSVPVFKYDVLNTLILFGIRPSVINMFLPGFAEYSEAVFEGKTRLTNKIGRTSTKNYSHSPQIVQAKNTKHAMVNNSS